tara:strand:+ start:1677 stop:2600 length:924 start_codon:yes stop_codon:yes gene_type:complete
MKQQKKVILLAGPTASGKSKLAIKLARYYNSEIINADSMQVYKEISILTSRPSIKDTKIARHHLYGFVSVKKNFSTGLWLKAVIKKIKKQWKKNKTPIVVGGTGLYFKALTEGMVKIPDIPKKLRSKTRMLHKRIGQKKFYTQLVKIDPLAKKFILATDSQRSIRAYEIKKFTNKSLFSLIKKTKPNFNCNIYRKIFINIPRDVLHKKIEERVEKMFNNNVLLEVKKFYKMKIKNELPPNKIIGIREIRDYLKGKIALDRAKELIRQKTRQYAKRQFTWARGHMKSWEMIYSSNINDLFKKSINKIS